MVVVHYNRHGRSILVLGGFRSSVSVLEDNITAGSKNVSGIDNEVYQHYCRPNRAQSLNTASRKA